MYPIACTVFGKSQIILPHYFFALPIFFLLLLLFFLFVSLSVRRIPRPFGLVMGSVSRFPQTREEEKSESENPNSNTEKTSLFSSLLTAIDAYVSSVASNETRLLSLVRCINTSLEQSGLGCNTRSLQKEEGNI